MSKEIFDLKKKEIAAVSDDSVKLPNMPVFEAVQEAENLFAWCQDDKASLTKAGLDCQLVDDLPFRVGAYHKKWTRRRDKSEVPVKEG